MVRRKPVGEGSMVPAPQDEAVNDPPYPVTPTTETPTRAPPVPPSSDQPAATNSGLHPASSFEIVGKPNADVLVDEPSDHEDSDSDWDKDDTDYEDDQEEATHGHDIPASLKAGGSRDISPHPGQGPPLPDVLKVGPSSGLPGKSQESLVSEHSQSANAWATAPSQQRLPSVPLQSNNPYLRMQNSGQSNPSNPAASNPALANPSSIWGDNPTNAPESQQAPVELPAATTPGEPAPPLPVAEGKRPAIPETGPERIHSFQQPGLLSVEAEKEASKIFDGVPSSSQGPVPAGQVYSAHQQHEQPADPWADQLSQLDELRIDDATAKNLAHMDQAPRNDIKPWGEDGRATELVPNLPPRPQENVPEESPRPDETPPMQPPRPGVTSAAPPPPRIMTASPGTVEKQRKEHYSIKHTRWYDDSIGKVRESPILTQNANGPCPLLALVNALVLSTPFGVETALIEALRTREQVSLGLLLDAVFDELMSGRRGSATQQLPDVGELFQFLLALHTGMNVNPLLVPKAVEAPNLMDADGPLAEVHPALREPGGFEETREMRLYSTFNIPLIHGWLPSKGSEAYVAFSRAARTFDDALNIQFREEELDEKLRTTGLSPDDIKLFEDITCIKEFLQRWPTQLTTYGLDVLQQHLQPGAIAIFFRNDHFSTLYKEPKSGRLMSLVTDAGYATHDEIVWESLVDVNGAGNELFSGDFRPVGGPSTTAPSASGSNDGAGGTRSSSSRPVRSMLDIEDSRDRSTAATNQGRSHQAAPSLESQFAQETGVLPASAVSAADAVSPVSTTREEQEDHDLALALQLQEEEEDRHRRETAARREREDRLSQQYLDGQGQAPGRGSNTQDIRPLIPPRRGQNAAAPTGARTTSEAEEDAPPPTYEQASRRPAFNPPRNHPASPHAPLGAGGGSPAGRGSGRPLAAQAHAENQAQTGRRRQTSLGDRMLANAPGAYPGRGRGRGAEYGGIGQGIGQPVGEERERCVVM